MDCEEIKALIERTEIECCDKCHDEYHFNKTNYPVVIIDEKEYWVCCNLATVVLSTGVGKLKNEKKYNYKLGKIKDNGETESN